jgi:hypothetical protein
MTRVVIAARTRMRHDHICVGAHALDGHFKSRFRSMRLLDKYGDHWRIDSPFHVGDIWEIRYDEKVSARPPHVEDVFVMEYRPIGREENLKDLVLRYRRPWSGGPDALFDRTLRATEHGGGYIPKKGPIPRCSTGYWLPDHDLVASRFDNMRFLWTGDGPIKRLKWVGDRQPPARIEAGSLVRVSLSRLYGNEQTPEGYYVQLSGVL